MSVAKKLNPSVTRIAAPAAESALRPAALWNKKVLVVDDEPEIVKIFSEMLSPKLAPAEVRSSRLQLASAEPGPRDERFEFEVVTATSAEEALSAVRALLAKGETFALGFFDVRLGQGLDGVDLVKEVFKLMPTIYAVFVTAYNDRTIDSIASTLGVSQTAHWDYMNKPFNVSAITQKARNFVALYNLQREHELVEQERSELNRKVLVSERVSSVAAVARGVAHEFGNLLMQILGKAEVSRLKPEAEMRIALDRIIEASQRAHEILDRFNNLSDTKAEATQKSWTQIDKIVEEAVDLLGHQFKKARTQVWFDKTKSVAGYVHSTSLLQVLVNLFINSLHAMGDDGRIDISLTANGDSFDLNIRDYGPGVPKEILDRVLEPFFTTKGDMGTGLGLAISREIVEIDHAGEFKIFNHEKKGFCVQMHFPIPKQQTEVKNG